MSAEVAAAAITAGGQLLNSAASGSWIDGGHSARKQARYQQQLNKDMALWNMENVTRPVYDLEQQQWETRFNMENAYNDPSEQIKRMRNAGINPAGINFDTGVPAASPSANEAASQMAAPADYGQMEALQNARQTNLNQAVNTLSQAVLNSKSGNNYDANAEQTREETRELKGMYGGKLTLQGIEIMNGGMTWLKGEQDLALGQELIKNAKLTGLEIQKKMDDLDSQIKYRGEQMKKIMSENEYQKLVNKNYEKMQNVLIEEAMSRIGCNRAQAEQLVQNAHQSALENTILSNEIDLEWNPETKKLKSGLLNGSLRLSRNGLIIEGKKQKLDEKETDYALKRTPFRQMANTSRETAEYLFYAVDRLRQLPGQSKSIGNELMGKGMSMYYGGKGAGKLSGTLGSMTR